VQFRRKVSLLLLAACCTVAIPAAAQQDQDTRGTPATSKDASPVEQRIDINHATVDELARVPGLPRSWAERIVRYRPYRAKTDLVDQGIVSDQVYARIRDFIVAHKKAEQPR